MRMRIKDFTTKVGSGVTPRGGAEVYQSEGIPLFRSQNVTNEGLLLDDIAYISKEIHESMSSTRLRANDVLLNITGASIGRCYYLPKDFTEGNVNQHVCIIRPTSKVLSPYLYYCLISNEGQQKIELTQTGANREGLSKEDICNFEFDIPPLEEQSRIVSYLNDKTGKIDARVSLLTKKRDAYQRLKKALISRVVTKGLNPNAKFKPSGVDWIGEIPEGWEVLHFKRNLSINNGRDYKHIEVDEGYPVIGSGGTFANASEYLYDGEALLLGRKGTIDRPLYINGKFWTVDTMFYAVPNRKTCCKYMYYQASTSPLARYSTNTALPSMTQTSLQNLLMCFPPLPEQQSIASYLDEKCSEIDANIANLEKQIEKYKELKRALISEVVTGKRRV